jgi:uncharacterized membrane protein
VTLWLARYRVLSFCRNSLWFLPVLSIFLALGAVRVLHAIEKSERWHTEHAAGSVSVVLSSLASAVFTLIVFVASAFLITMQLASAQLTPRIIGLLFRDPVLKAALTLFVFTFTFTLSTLLRIDDQAHALTSTVAAWSCVASLAVFLLVIDHVGRALRPSGTVRRVAHAARAVILEVYPRALAEGGEDQTVALPGTAAPVRTVASMRDGVVQAIDIRGLLRLAQAADALVELVPQVGDFVTEGGPLFRVHGGGASLDDASLRSSVALGQERTHEQDPAFSLRIIVDIACKALSPAVNDPTTAVAAIDYAHQLLGELGRRRLDGSHVLDAAGRPRLLYRTPRWPDYVRLAVTEIRLFGGESIQVARRLRAMIEGLLASLPAERAAPLREELKLLCRTTARGFDEPEDRALADVGDQQGVGGAPTQLHPDPGTPGPEQREPVRRDLEP